MIRRTARALATLHTDRVALELMNEPQYGWDSATIARWQRLLEFLHSEARAEAPDLLLVLSGARGGDIKGLLALDPAPFAGSRVLYSFHYYEPHDFTHQGVKSTTPSARPWRYISGLPYPAQSADPDRVWQKIQQNILSDPSIVLPDQRRLALQQVRDRVSSYIASGFGRRQIASDFDSVRAWAELHNIDARAILLGEFGVTRTYGMYRASDPISQEAWLHDVRREAELHGFDGHFGRCPVTAVWHSSSEMAATSSTRCRCGHWASTAAFELAVAALPGVVKSSVPRSRFEQLAGEC